MADFGALPASYAQTRSELQRVAVHIIARRRHLVSGRFGLRATPGGFGTPAFGDPIEVVRVLGAHLVREIDKQTQTAAIDGASLSDLASFAGVDLAADFSVGNDTPPVGDVKGPITADAESSTLLGAWYSFAWQVAGRVVSSLDPSADPAVMQLWPEHFDAAVDVPGSGEVRVNLGGSPGDGYLDEPYLYVGPWGPDRPGDAAYWNAPFGATLSYGEVRKAADPYAVGADFLAEGLARFRKG